MSHLSAQNRLGLGTIYHRETAPHQVYFLKTSVNYVLVEQYEASLYTRYLTVNDKFLEWQLRAEQAKSRLNQQKTTTKKQ
jgi:hypothetical protein